MNEIAGVTARPALILSVVRLAGGDSIGCLVGCSQLSNGIKIRLKQGFPGCTCEQDWEALPGGKNDGSDSEWIEHFFTFSLYECSTKL